MKQRKVAVFDVDGTIFRSSLLIALVEALVEAKLFPKKATYVYAKSYQDWLDRKGGYDAYIMDVVRVFEENLKNLKHTNCTMFCLLLFL